MTITVSHLDVEERGLHDSSIAPIVDCLVLDEYVEQEIEEVKDKLEGLWTYVWYAEANYDKAEKYYLAAVAASKNGVADAVAFFMEALEDVFNFDRALGASVVHKTRKPLRREKIPERLRKRDPRSGQYLEYQLIAHEFKWSDTIPSEAALKAAEVMTTNPPDTFWIAEYEQQSLTNDPIIYASYGWWQVEVARWA